MILSNKLRNGQAVGLGDAGQGWHTDMSYSKEIAFATFSMHSKFPAAMASRSAGRSLPTCTAAYEDLPKDIKTRLAGRTAIHDFEKFWEMMRSRPGSTRGPLTPQQRAKKPPVSHPIFMTHPITGRHRTLLQSWLRNPD